MKRLISGLLCAAALSAAAGEAKVTRVGAVNWDCSTPSFTFFGHYATQSLGPEKFRDRTPYYAKVVGKDKIDYRFRTVAEYEREMQYAIDAGIDYFAYCWYDKMPQPPPRPSIRAATADPFVHEITRARQLHAKSVLRDKLHLCAILVSCHLFSDDELADLATEMREPWYEKVEGRPLVYLFFGLGPIERLREICRRDGTPEPYAVLMDTRGQLVTEKTRPQLQAISSYGYTGDGKDFAAFTANAMSANASRANVGLPAIPHFATGWDPTPRIENPVPWANYPAGRPYQVAKSAADFLYMASELKKWMNANAEKCPTGHVMTFAWNEFEEGGWICPNLGADGRPDTSRVKAFAEAVRILKDK